MKIPKLFVLLAIFLTSFSSYTMANDYETDFLELAKKKVEAAIQSNQTWDGPKSGPQILQNKSVFFVASDLRNGGVYGVAKGISEAATHLDWQLKFFDGRGSAVRQGALIREAISLKPDGIVLGGIDALRHKDILKLAEQLNVVVVGWHASELAGENKELGLYTNITTDPLEVAEVAALLAIVNTEGQAKTVIFTDPNYKIASIKAQKLADTIRLCRTCSVLDIQPLALDKIAQSMPKTLNDLWSKYGNEITHILTINDLYIDYATPFLESRLEQRKKIPANISAGDGSEAAYQRIYQQDFQLATVPEPLYLHGWQIMDELNRAFNAYPPSGYSTPVHLVTPNNVDELISSKNTGVYDPKNGYRETYLNIWSGK
ncbi:substrate-binding domain-containing protein [Marinomonas sp. C2222]|uniref:Substrate-binding domain-containing protein n=1 Tax=Marinomonas sargassi TaxID=2984494 RepID=A0ABT2YPR3_9GAMM|nr:substrate-binding domain-containing protein [Marinomonas sargassi]MCV2401867.1 substrate-binding domain-containing protein [Marinomonas sargassi]